MHYGLEQKGILISKKILTAVSFHSVLAPLSYRTEECLAYFLETLLCSGELLNGNKVGGRTGRCLKESRYNLMFRTWCCAYLVARAHGGG
jgi:hypothetical protein